MTPAFWDGGRKFIVRFTPTEPGDWIYKISSNIPSLEGKEGKFTAAESDAPGYIHVANVHHWATDNKKAHLWMGYVLTGADIDSQIAAMEANKFNHARLTISNRSYLGGDQPDTAYFDALDKRILALHKKQITTDLVLATDPAALLKVFPDWQQRKRFIRYVVARYGSLNITWGGVEEFEGHRDARALLKELGLALKELDPYRHPRSTNAKISSSPFLSDGWMDFVIDHSSNDQIGAVEHQFYQVPFVAVTTASHLWSATMNGQYPVLEGEVGKTPKIWFEFMADTRHWELEPDFNVDAARCVSLEGIEYIVLVEKSGPVELEVEKHGYDVLWFNPLTGEYLEQKKKKYSGEHYTGAAPDTSHQWILLVAREGRKESMLKSYKFESRIVPVQEIETLPAKVPFVIETPAGDAIANDARFSIKVTKGTRATRTMMYVWSGEAPADGLGFRILGTGAQGSLQIPKDIAIRYPAVVSVRVSALNANGKAYAVDKVYTLNQ